MPTVHDQAAHAFASAFEQGIRAAIAELQPGAELGELTPQSWASLLGVALKGCLECGLPAEQISAAVAQAVSQL